MLNLLIKLDYSLCMYMDCFQSWTFTVCQTLPVIIIVTASFRIGQQIVTRLWQWVTKPFKQTEYQSTFQATGNFYQHLNGSYIIINCPGDRVHNFSLSKLH